MTQDSLHNRTERNRFTRMCIGEAIVALMKKKEYDKIKISEIVEKAGVSRMTYYHYYETKNDALNDYFKEIVNMYVLACEKRGLVGEFHSSRNIRFALEFFDEYADFIMTLNKNGLYSIIIEGMNRYIYSNFSPLYQGNEFELYFYAGGLLNIFIKWQEKGKEQSKEEIADIIEKML